MLIFHVARSTDDVDDPWDGVEVEADSPFTLTGDVEQMVETLQQRRDLWGLNYPVFFDRDREVMTPVVQRLTGS